MTELRLPFTPALPLATERLVLRRFGAADRDPLLAYHSMAEVARYVPWAARSERDIDGVVERKMACTGLAAAGDVIEVAVTLARDDRLVGDVMIALGSTVHQTAEIGFVFDPRHHGKGYATEAASALVRMCFEEAGLRRLIARTDARNTASHRLCERLGMRREAQLLENEWMKGELTSEVDYGLLAREWESSR
ncbi:MAG: hypothetical protein V7607_2596 [Solirubrobacteraceae bacterium]